MNPIDSAKINFCDIDLKLNQLTDSRFHIDETIKNNNLLKDVKALSKQDNSDFYEFCKEYKDVFYFLLNNSYLKLQSYLWGREFKEFQTKYLHLEQGLFAYHERKSHTLRYLFGSQSLKNDRTKIKPHFYLRNFFTSNGVTYEEDFKSFLPIMEIFYLARKNIPVSQLDFIKILQNENIYSFKRTNFEKEFDIIYASSGEMDNCILCWFLLMQDNISRDHLINLMPDNIDKKESSNFLFNESVKLKFYWEEFHEWYYAKDKKDDDYDIFKQYYPYQNVILYLKDWLLIFGFIKSAKSIFLTERGRTLVEWMEIYLLSLQRIENKFQSEIRDNNYYKLLQLFDGKEKDYWLLFDKTKMRMNNLNLYEKLITMYIKSVSEARKTDFQDEELNAQILCALLSILANWEESGVDKENRVKSFQRRCRFNLLGHFTYRAGKKVGGKIANCNLGWLVFPVLREGSEIVGHFLGSIKDSDSEGNSFFDNKDNSKEFEQLISYNKAIINILAKVENREIYYKELKQAAEWYTLFRLLRHSHMQSLGAIRVSAKYIQDDNLRSTLNEIGRTLTDYLDILNHFYELPSYLDDVEKLKEKSIVELINNETQKISMILPYRKLALKYFQKWGDDKEYQSVLKKHNESGVFTKLNKEGIDDKMRINVGAVKLVIKECLVNALENMDKINNPLIELELEEIEEAQLKLQVRNSFPLDGVDYSEEFGDGRTIIHGICNAINWNYIEEKIKNSSNQIIAINSVLTMSKKWKNSIY